MFKKLINWRSHEQRKQDVIENAFRNIHSIEFGFSIEEQTEIIQELQKKQFKFLEDKLSELELVKNEIDNLSIISIND